MLPSYGKLELLAKYLLYLAFYFSLYLWLGLSMIDTVVIRWCYL